MNSALSSPESYAGCGPARRSSDDSGNRPGCSCRRAGSPGEVAPRPRDGGRCADRSGPWASWVRSAGCRGRAARVLRSAGRLRSRARRRPRSMCAGDALRGQQRIEEAFVLLAGRTDSSDNRRSRRAICRSAKRGKRCDRSTESGVDDGADAVVEEQAAGAREPGDFVGQGIAGQRAGGDDDDADRRELRALLRAGTRYSGCAAMARVTSAENISRSTVSAWPPGTRARAAALQDERSEPAQFLFQQPGSGAFLFGLQGITANQFGQPVRLVGRRWGARAAFREAPR